MTQRLIKHKLITLTMLTDFVSLFIYFCLLRLIVYSIGTNALLCKSPIVLPSIQLSS